MQYTMHDNMHYNMHIESYACYNEGSATTICITIMHIESYACWKVSLKIQIESYACYNEGSTEFGTITILPFDSGGWKSEIPTLSRCALRAAS